MIDIRTVLMIPRIKYIQKMEKNGDFVVILFLKLLDGSDRDGVFTYADSPPTYIRKVFDYGKHATLKIQSALDILEKHQLITYNSDCSKIIIPRYAEWSVENG